MAELMGMPTDNFAVLIGKRGEDREFAAVPLTREQHRHFQRFIAAHIDELVEHMAEVGVDARTIVQPDLERFATPDDIRLYGTPEQRRSLIARLIADLRADEERAEPKPGPETMSIRDFANNIIVEYETPADVADRVIERIKGGNG